MKNATEFIAAILAAFVIVLGAYSYGVTKSLNAANLVIDTLNASIKENNNQAEKRLKELTDNRDKVQARYDKQQSIIKLKDEAAKNEIDRLIDLIDNTPIRVQYITREAGSCGGSTQSEGGGDPGNSSGGQRAGTGVLPESNHRRLRGAIKYIEQLSLAYNSARRSLYLCHQTFGETP